MPDWQQQGAQGRNVSWTSERSEHRHVAHTVAQESPTLLAMQAPQSYVHLRKMLAAVLSTNTAGIQRPHVPTDYLPLPYLCRIHYNTLPEPNPSSDPPWDVLEVHVFKFKQRHLRLAHKGAQAARQGALQQQAVQHGNAVTLGGAEAGRKAEDTGGQGGRGGRRGVVLQPSP